MINLNDILKVANGQLFGEPVANLFTDFCFDPQQVGEQLLFVAVRSDQGDTHQYIEEAIRRGAPGILCIDPPDCDTGGVSILMVRDTIAALLAWSRYTLRKLAVKTIAVAGSSGKSAALDAITHVLRKRYEVHAGEMDIDGRVNLARSLAKLNANHDYVVLKLSVTQPGEMAQMVEAVQPQIAVVNHIDCVHPANFADCDQFIDEQAVLIESLPVGALAVINYDDDLTRDMASRVPDGVQVKTVGIERFGADALAYNVKVSLERIGFDLRYASERYVGRWSPILGKHHLYSLLSALMVAVHCKIPLETALSSITELQPLPGRMAALAGQHAMTLIDDTYRAAHSSTLAALDWLEEVRVDGQRTIFVIGDLDDVGKNSQFGHRSIGQRAAEVADVIVTKGAEAALVGRAAIDSGKPVSAIRTTYSVQDTVDVLESLHLSSDDIVLVKGGAAAHMEEVVRALLADDADSSKLIRQNLAQPATPLFQSLRPTWVELDGQALAHNVRTIKAMVGDEVALMAVVKADAYGHGALRVARTALNNGAAYLGVASMAEAVDLRAGGIEAPILVLSYAPSQAVRQAIDQNITVTVYDLEQARMYDRAARYVTGKLKYHVKIDSGMGRLGIIAEDAINMFRYLQPLTNLELEGIYTHFASADEDNDYTEQQIEIFQNVVRPLRATGLHFTYIHAANSPAVLRGNHTYFNMVRPGLMLYGLQPSAYMQRPEEIKAVLMWKTTVLQVKHLPPGHPIGYGRTYYTRGEETIAVLPVGYSDGLRRSPKTWQYVLIHGQRAPLVGRVSMEKVMVDVSHISGVAAGDEVVLLGRQGDEEITAQMIAEWLDTINYEVVTTMLARVPRK